MRERYIPSPEDETPFTTTATVEPAPDSNPDSSRQFSHTLERGRQIGNSRKWAARLLAGGVFAGVLMGPEAVKVANDHQAAAARAEIAEVMEKPGSDVLLRAQLKAMKEFFSDGKGSYDYEAVQKMMEGATIKMRGDWQLPVSHFIDADEAAISADDKTVRLNERDYSFARYQTNEGYLYVLAGTPVEEDRLMAEDRVHMAQPMLIGGAKGTDKRALKKADANARGNIDEAFDFWAKPHGEIIIDRTGRYTGNRLLTKK